MDELYTQNVFIISRIVIVLRTSFYWCIKIKLMNVCVKLGVTAIGNGGALNVKRSGWLKTMTKWAFECEQR